MQEKGLITVFQAVTAAAMLMGAMIFASSGAKALSLAGYSGLKAAIYHATVTQEARYVCRGSHRRKCYHVSGPERTLRYNRSGWNGRYRGEANYNYYQWGSPNNDPY